MFDANWIAKNVYTITVLDAYKILGILRFNFFLKIQEKIKYKKYVPYCHFITINQNTSETETVVILGFYPDITPIF